MYHRLTFGYPGAKPFDKWKGGVPNLLRATEGPLMILGPKATSLLGYEGTGRYSAASSSDALPRTVSGPVVACMQHMRGGRLAS